MNYKIKDKLDKNCVKNAHQWIGYASGAFICHTCEYKVLKRNKEMTKFIVTIKEYQQGHNPRDKKTGICGTSSMCTDSTGHHHSIIVDVMEIDEIQDLLNSYFQKEVHITRIELAVEVY